jgi:ATP-dependent RNA helicase DHX29
MLLFGAILRCLSPILTIAATLSYKSPFESSKASNSQVEAAMKAFATPASNSIAAGQQSDHLVFAAAYEAYLEACKENRNAGRRFAQKNALDSDTIRQISEMRVQYASLLADMGVINVPAGCSLRGKNTSWLDDPKAVRNLFLLHFFFKWAPRLRQPGRANIELSVRASSISIQQFTAFR